MMNCMLAICKVLSFTPVSEKNTWYTLLSLYTLPSPPPNISVLSTPWFCRCAKTFFYMPKRPLQVGVLGSKLDTAWTKIGAWSTDGNTKLTFSSCTSWACRDVCCKHGIYPGVYCQWNGTTNGFVTAGHSEIRLIRLNLQAASPTVLQEHTMLGLTPCLASLQQCQAPDPDQTTPALMLVHEMLHLRQHSEKN